jgi:hypothetical protein
MGREIGSTGERKHSGSGNSLRACVSLLGLALTAASCGGGGSSASSSSSSSGTETTAGQSESTSSDSAISTGPSLDLGSDAFYFAPSSVNASASSLNSVVSGGSSLYAGWRPQNPQTFLKPGMKIAFFGVADGCDSDVEGPLSALSASELSAAAAKTGLSVSAVGSDLSWIPSGAVEGCSTTAQTRTGASLVYLNASDADGGMALFTTSGTQSSGATPFFGPYTSTGQNGSGANAYIEGTFINFRQVWWSADPLQPWTGAADARIQSKQSISSYAINATGGATVQVKQQMMATFLNVNCAKTMSGKPCHIQYLLNTAVMRSGVSDWSKVAWFQDASLDFDPAQGGIPVIGGPIKTPGITANDLETGLPLYTSQGSSTQHETFTDRTFDVTISFEQLLNVVKMATAKSNGIDVSAVTESQITAMWGTGWSDRTTWVFLTGDVAQEIYNPGSGKVEIGGSFRNIYVGPQS